MTLDRETPWLTGVNSEGLVASFAPRLQFELFHSVLNSAQSTEFRSRPGPPATTALLTPSHLLPPIITF
jgi:hypothetical protein